MKIVACALALMMMQDIPYDFQMFAGFIFMLGVTMVAAPGVPGGAIMLRSVSCHPCWDSMRMHRH